MSLGDANRNASKLDDVSKKLGDMSKLFEAFNSEIPNYLTGVAGNACVTAFDKIQKDVTKMKDTASETADRIRMTVKKIKAEREREEKLSRGSSGKATRVIKSHSASV